MDCLQEEVEPEDEENYQKYEQEKSKSRQSTVVPVAPLSVISAGIGEITAKDVMIADAANG